MKNGTEAASSKNLLLKYKPSKNQKMNSAEGIQISSEEEGSETAESEVNQ